MANINLLPQELKPKAYVVKLSKTVKKVAIASVIGLIVVTTVLIAGVVLLSTQLSASVKKQKELTTEIENLKNVEQRLYFVRDRLNKLSALDASPDAKEEIVILTTILSELPENIIFDEAQVQTDVAAVTLIIPSSKDISRLLAGVIGHGYSRIDLFSFSFDDKKGGYKMEIGVRE